MDNTEFKNKSMQADWEQKLNQQTRNKVGRPAVLTPEQISWAKATYREGNHTLVQLANVFNVSSETIRLAIK
ncbi:hypothetical protein [Aeromonas salmonicida]|uniref:hypothetical protein n=1 Tax=Aeromonas salmonicida TaxID=645 RepID=UPI003D1DC971